MEVNPFISSSHQKQTRFETVFSRHISNLLIKAYLALKGVNRA